MTNSNPSVKLRPAVENNRHIISNALADYLLTYGRMPKRTTLAEITGLSRRTIYNHFERQDFKLRFEKFKALTEHVMAHLFTEACSTKNPQMIRLWLETIEGFGGKFKPEEGSNAPMAPCIINWGKPTELHDPVLLGRENADPV